MKTKSKIILSICLSLAVVFTSFCIGIGLKLYPTRVVSASFSPGRTYYTDGYSLSTRVGFSDYVYSLEWNFVGITPVNFNYMYLWSDGVDIYYTQGSNNYVFNRSTNTFDTITIGYANATGYDVWTDGVRTFYSSGNYIQCIFDRNTLTWSDYTWNGFHNFKGRNIWTNGVDIFYSANTSVYKFDSVANSFSYYATVIDSLIGEYVWNDGVNYFYSYGGSDYILDFSNNTIVMTSISFSNKPSSLNGAQIWSDNVNTYYSFSDYGTYIFDSSNYSWSSIDFGGFNGLSVWTDGVDIYNGFTSKLTRSNPVPPGPPVSPYSGLLADAMYAFGAGLSGMYSMIGGVIESTFGDLFVETIDGTQFLSAFGNIIFIVLGIILAIHVARFVIHYFIKRSERC